MKYLLLTLLMIGCTRYESFHETVTIEKVIKCLQINCRVEFNNGQRQTVGVAAIGDKYRRQYRIHKGKKIHPWGKKFRREQ